MTENQIGDSKPIKEECTFSGWKLVAVSLVMTVVVIAFAVLLVAAFVSFVLCCSFK